VGVLILPLSCPPNFAGVEARTPEAAKVLPIQLLQTNNSSEAVCKDQHSGFSLRIFVL